MATSPASSSLSGTELSSFCGNEGIRLFSLSSTEGKLQPVLGLVIVSLAGEEDGY